jgi:energy-coupling factor transporter ATP-binding protein EcfA2
MDVDFGHGQSLAVYGDNGTGKSTLADALEWFFTGQIELLSHEGRQHAIRNLSAADGGETSVEVVTSGDLGGKVVFPDARGPEALGLASRETFLLRGRTLADFINKTKTEKWKALAELLGLDTIELLRQDLQRARTDIKKQVKTAEEKIATARRALSAGDATITEEGVLDTLQQICGGLGVEVPQSLAAVTDKAWIAGVAGESAALGAPKLEMLSSTASGLRTPTVDERVIAAWITLVSKEQWQDNVPLLTLFRDADALLSSAPHPHTDGCPLCGQAISKDALTARVRRVLTDLLESSRATERIREGIVEWRDALVATLDQRRALVNLARPLRIKLSEPPPLPIAIAAALDARAALELAGLKDFQKELERWDAEARAAIATNTPADAGTRQSQLALLAVICEHIRTWHAADKELARSQTALELADRLYDAYQERQKKQLESILTSISRRVAEIYGALHPGEDLSRVTVEPWTAKGLELAVDFHGSKQRPPHGVLSESHLNSLAIALFLAMAQTFNEKLRFLVLDDVINSFDLEHRGELASLLAEKFDDWQLVVLTHDRQFFDHLARRAPSWKRLEITSWSYEGGPRMNSSSGILEQAQERLAQGDVGGAATKARRTLEELLQEICEALEAELPFRRGTKNDQREIGELLRGLRRAVKEHAKPMLKTLEPLLKHLEADVSATFNVEAHASRGRSGTAEVESALRRLEELDRMWSCPECGTRLWHKGTPESSRCRCGKSVFPPSSAS